jgi:NAD(P)-dependent dehydrogenase (short-subunit alcohol dehydrogenase family)
MTSKWTAADIPDLSGAVAVVTGANSGLGFETALELARHGAKVVLSCRDLGRGEDAAGKIRAEAPRAKTEVTQLDLADLSSVRAFAEDITRRYERIDVLVNNAGVMALAQRRLTADGFEMQLGTNHLGHFALTGLLLPALVVKPDARVVSVTSFAHRTARMRFDDLHSERRYRKWMAYGQSKLANLLFTFELDRRARAAGVGLVAAAGHPGFASTHLQDGTSFGPARIVAQSAAEGAWPILYAATAEGVEGGDFFGPNGPFGLRGNPGRATPARRATDADAARTLWDASEELTGVRYEFVAR